MHVSHLYLVGPVFTLFKTCTDHLIGPFELIKLNAQLAGKMARETNLSDRPAPIHDIRGGAFRTAQQLLRERGIRGLYCGYRLHLGKLGRHSPSFWK